MNTFKNNLEYQIKKQIDERQVAPSRDLWSEIQAQTENSGSKKSNLNWILLAACFVLVFGLGAVLFFDNEAEPKVQVAETVKNPDLIEENETTQPQKINSQDIIVKENQEKLVQVNNTSSQEKIEKIVPVKNNLPLIKENPSVIASQMTLNPPTKIMAKSDSIKIQKKKRYVDPSTLLFSVEHKDVIDKSKGGSNVATIDLNTK
ncbi:hypothetical protein NAL32_15470 [Chryseobacterium sp. Ch-15]|uniref:Uncharacterized protein n=1 Tax=Chryseobacterium muglaense TaxID=2893752 RepID=A0A9Q3UWR5_9FLAO|nr:MULTISPECIES: hypothetical protein [Chryseobacterium]MBD3905985.1 hypothetical protein [Chryseobacterium muglaense]MBO6185258.1 hypothetical protein [Chryseobacterium sp.]MCC9035070.1 hypothetical protein [Chryseobacterium muglaense]MCM2555783.1 hypothetical protein [Chryseobacterium muglaense]